MLDKNDILEIAQQLNDCIYTVSDGKYSLIEEIIEFMSTDELNNMLNNICNTWFNCSLDEIDNVMNAVDKAEEMRYIIE